MADGKHKNGVAITVIYQAVNEATGKTIKMDVYDEAHAEDVGKAVAAMTEFAATGRYYGVFTPDAEGDWTVVMKNTTDSNGAIVKFYPVGGHNIDSIGDDIANLNNLAAGDLNNLATSDFDTALATYDPPTKTEMDTKIDALTDIDSAGVNAACDTALTDYDAATGTEIGALNDLSAANVATELETYDAVKKSELDAVQGGSETLESIKTAVDAFGSPAMAG